MSTTTDIRDVIVIGSGPAGCTAVSYTARAGLSPSSPAARFPSVAR